jgi:hypothetical protein
MNDTHAALERAYAHALDWVDLVRNRTSTQRPPPNSYSAPSTGHSQTNPADPATVVDALAAAAEPGLVATPSGRLCWPLTG